MPVREKKLNRRIAYTCRAIKDSLLELMREKPFDSISVTAVCATAEVTRTTFYTYYNDLNQVLDELIEDAFELAKQNSSNAALPLPLLLDLLLRYDTVELLRAHNSALPPCQRIADDTRYRVLFKDPGLCEYIKGKLFALNRPWAVPSLAEYCHISEDEAEQLFRYQLSGSYGVNVALGWVKDDKWFEARINIIRMEAAGIEAVRAAHENK